MQNQISNIFEQENKHKKHTATFCSYLGTQVLIYHIHKNSSCLFSPWQNKVQPLPHLSSLHCEIHFSAFILQLTVWSEGRWKQTVSRVIQKLDLINIHPGTIHTLKMSAFHESPTRVNSEWVEARNKIGRLLYFSAPSTFNSVNGSTDTFLVGQMEKKSWRWHKVLFKYLAIGLDGASFSSYTWTRECPPSYRP